MDKNIKQQLQQAVERSRQWAINGWLVTFGDREVVVSSLHQAENLPASAVHRQIAVGYWHNVAQIGHEAATWGEKALQYLADNDIQAAEAAVYYACYMERPLARHTMTWEPVLRGLQKVLCPSGDTGKES